MYERPKLERFGTFRELTQGGSNRYVDLSAMMDTDNADTCDPNQWCAVPPSHS
jgi:hypothetical protein